MVRSWAVELKRNANLKLSDIARKHGLSRARVTQLMPLALLDEKLITEKLRMNRKASVRDLLKLAVQTRPNN